MYKLIGPVMVKQGLTDARTNVDKRLEFITKDLERAQQLCADMEKELEAKKENIIKIQQAAQGGGGDKEDDE